MSGDVDDDATEDRRGANQVSMPWLPRIGQDLSATVSAYRSRAEDHMTIMRHRSASGMSALAALALLAACTVSSPRPVDPPLPDLEPSFVGSMTITPATAKPGDRVRIWFPDHRLRGIAFSMESPTPAGWRAAFNLNSGVRSNDDPGPWAAVGDRFGSVDIGVGGPGGQQLRVPDIAVDGVYRLCTANAPEKACALLTVSR
jgi:hypothetical protein